MKFINVCEKGRIKGLAERHGQGGAAAAGGACCAASTCPTAPFKLVINSLNGGSSGGSGSSGSGGGSGGGKAAAHAALAAHPALPAGACGPAFTMSFRLSVITPEISELTEALANVTAAAGSCDYF